MTLASIETRLRKVERHQCLHGDLERMSDAQLHALIRSDYRRLRREHGSLAAAARHFRRSGDADSVALATLIEEDIGGADAEP